MTPLILHIPHASTVIPPDCRADFIIDDSTLAAHLAASTDHFTDELFDSDATDVTNVRFPISRLALDPERFESDELEPMAAVGLGVLYERGHNGQRIRAPLNAARREYYLSRWFRPHHAQLEAAVDAALVRSGYPMIIDAHSFPDAPFELDIDKTVPRPDACIGTAGIHTPAWLIDAAQTWCSSQGWTLGIDAPYAGTIVPIKHYQRDARVRSIMIEINRKRYMTVSGVAAVRTVEFHATRAFVAGFVMALRNATNGHSANQETQVADS